MMLKLRLLGLSLVAIGIIEGCGMMSKSEDESPQSLSLPQKISVEIPSVLKKKSTKSEKRLQKDEVNSSKSIGFMELQDNIAYLESQKSKLKTDLLFMKQVMNEIGEACQEIEQGATCSIVEDTLSFSVSTGFKEELDQIDAEESGLYDIGEKIYLGAIDFVQYSQSNTYQYGLKLQNFNSGESSTSIEWSADEKHVNSLYQEGGEEQNTIHIDYQSTQQGEVMEVEDGLTMPDYNDAFYFHFSNDDQAHYKLYAKAKIFENGVQTEAYASDGEITSEGGDILFAGIYPEYRIREYERFDQEGNSLYDEWCTSEDEACLISDEATWLMYGDNQYLPGDSEGMNERFDRLEEGIGDDR